MKKIEKRVSKSFFRRNLNFLCFSLIAVFIVLGTAGCDETSQRNEGHHVERREPGVSIDEYRQNAENKLNEQLKDSSHPLRKRVEEAHVTVTVNSAYVSDMKITTKNGKNRIVKESDIRRIEVDITSLWAGFIDRGKTVVHLVVEDTGDGLKPIEANISYTDAIVNIEDPKFWFAVASVALL